MTDPSEQNEPIEFIGVVYRIGALLADGVVFIALYAPLAYAAFGRNEFGAEAAQQAAPVLAMVVLVAYLLGWWIFAGTSPGKWFCSARIVDFKTGKRAHTGRLVLRLLACVLSAAPLMLGFLWAARDPYKRALHDLIARTAVIGDSSLRPPTTDEQDDVHYCIRPAPWAPSQSA